MPLANGHRREPVQEPVHDLNRRLGCSIANTASDDHRAVPVSCTQADVAQVLAKASNETHRSSGAERCQVVVVHLVTEPRIPNLVEPCLLYTSDAADE